MTDKAKALGLPADEQILQKLTEITHQSKPFYIEQRLFGAKWMRSEAESRIKEVAIEFNIWTQEHGWHWSKIEQAFFQKGTRNALRYDSKTRKDELFDIFLKERGER